MKVLQKLTKKILRYLLEIVMVIFIGVSAFLCFSISWMFQTWTNLTMDELMYHLSSPLDGTNQEMIVEYLNACVTPTILILFGTFIVLIVFRKTKKQYYIILGIGTLLPLVMSGVFLRYTWLELNVSEYIEAKGTESDFVESNYVNPVDVEITFPEKKRNLIYIFLESMETTYADKDNGGAFKQNVIPELTQLAQDNEDFSGDTMEINGGYAMSGSGWTMGAMFAHTSGLPLSIPIEVNDMDTQETFFPGIITLGDILEKAGYSQTLMIGSDATFGGRKLYFLEHGNYDIIDYNYALETSMIPADYRVWWGYEDQKLFSFAKEKLLELSGQEEPFNFTMLTVDTHFEDGWVCELCSNTFDNEQYANVMACSSKQISEFINWIKQQDFYENTTIVLMGDHPTMDSDFCLDIDKGEYVRRVYTAYINSNTEVTTNSERTYATFDSFPTTLAALGVEIEGNRLGLGTNLFSSEQTLLERFGYEKEEQELKKKSEFMEHISQIDKNSIELMRREGRIPYANVSTDVYQYERGVLPVFLTEISGELGNITSVNIAVWTEENQSDLQWIQMEKVENEGIFYGEIYVPNFGYNVGEYHIQAYITDGSENQYMVGETVGYVD